MAFYWFRVINEFRFFHQNYLKIHNSTIIFFDTYSFFWFQSKSFVFSDPEWIEIILITLFKGLFQIIRTGKYLWFCLLAGENVHGLRIFSFFCLPRVLAWPFFEIFFFKFSQYVVDNNSLSLNQVLNGRKKCKHWRTKRWLALALKVLLYAFVDIFKCRHRRHAHNILSLSF